MGRAGSEGVGEIGSQVMKSTTCTRGHVFVTGKWPKNINFNAALASIKDSESAMPAAKAIARIHFLRRSGHRQAAVLDRSGTLRSVVDDTRDELR
jgi:hypothetical protein